MLISISIRTLRTDSLLVRLTFRIISLNGRDAALRVKSTIYLPTSVMRNRTIVNAQMGTLSIVVDQALYAALVIANDIIILVKSAISHESNSSEITINSSTDISSVDNESPVRTPTSPETLSTSFSFASTDHSRTIASSEETQTKESTSIKRDIEVRAECDAFELRINSLPASKDLQSRFHRDEFNQLFYIFVHGVAFQMTKQEEEEVSLSIGSAGIQFDQGNDAYFLLQHLGEMRDSFSDSNPFVSIKIASGITNIMLSSWGLDIRPILLLHYANFILSVFDAFPLEQLCVISPKQKATKSPSTTKNDMYVHILNPSIRLLINNETEESIMGSMQELQFIISSSALNAKVSKLKLSIDSAELAELTICQDFTGAVGISHVSERTVDFNVSRCEIQFYPRLLGAVESLLEMVSVTKSSRIGRV